MKKKIIFASLGVLGVSAAAITPIALTVKKQNSSNNYEKLINNYSLSLQEYDKNDIYPRLKHIEENETGFVKLFQWARPYIEKEHKIEYTDKNINKYFKTNQKKSLSLIKTINSWTEFRGFWSSIGNFFKKVGTGIVDTAKTVENGIKNAAKTVGHAAATAGGAIAGAVTFGQVDAVNKFIKDQAKYTGDSFIDTIDGGLKIFFDTSLNNIIHFFKSGDWMEIKNWKDVAVEAAAWGTSFGVGKIIGGFTAKKAINTFLKNGIKMGLKSAGGYAIKKISTSTSKNLVRLLKKIDVNNLIGDNREAYLVGKKKDGTKILYHIV